MFGLPESTELRKPLYKKAIFEKFALDMSDSRKKRFDQDIGRIWIIHEISPVSVNIKEGPDVKVIFAVLIDLKEQEYDEKNIALIARMFGQNLLLVLRFEDQYQLAIYQTRLLHSDWINENGISLKLEGFDLDGVWQNLVIQISGIIPEKERSLDEQISVEAEKEKLRKQIAALEGQKKRELQSKKKFEMHERLLEYKKRLEEM